MYQPAKCPAWPGRGSAGDVGLNVSSGRYLRGVCEGAFHGCESIPRTGKAGIDRHLAKDLADLSLARALPACRAHIDRKLYLLIQTGEHRDGAQRTRLWIEHIPGVDLPVDELDDVAVQLGIESLEKGLTAFDVLGA